MSYNSRPQAGKRASTSTSVYEEDPASQRFVIGKIDAGIAVLISDSVHLIEFPSLLLPSGVGPGSIVNIACTRNFAAERESNKSFWDLQNDIFTEFGAEEPEPPKLRVRNTTQTSVTLEWDKLQLAKAKLLSLSIWRNGQRLTTIPNPLNNTSTKLSGLSLDTDYTFHLVLKTSAGTFSSPIVKTRTHTISDTSGISVCFGHVEPEELLNKAKSAIQAMKAKQFDKIQIDTTHFVATSPASPSNPNGGPGPEYQKALQLSIPVVSPEWVIACQREQKMVPISNYYIGTVNHAASISSAQLVTPTGQIPPAKPARRATTATIAEENAPTPIPAVAPAPSNLPPSELAEEEPEMPPSDSVAQDQSPAPAENQPSDVPQSTKIDAPAVSEAPRAPTPTIAIHEPEPEPEPEPEAEKPEPVAQDEPSPASPPTPTFNVVAPPEDNVAGADDVFGQEPEQLPVELSERDDGKGEELKEGVTAEKAVVEEEEEPEDKKADESMEDVKL